MTELLMLLPALIGVLSMALFLPSIRKQMKIFCWPRLDAHFQDGDLENALPKFGWAANNDKKPSNYFREPYVYYLAGQRYEGYQILPDMSTEESKKRLRLIIEKLREAPDKSFQIFVNPNQPKESYVAVSNPVLQWHYVLMYAIFFWVSSMGLYLFLA